MDLVGLLAAACVLATFSMQSMIALRAFAIASNVLFIVYGATSHLIPIVLLHAILLPINGWSLGREWGRRIARHEGLHRYGVLVRFAAWRYAWIGYRKRQQSRIGHHPGIALSVKEASIPSKPAAAARAARMIAELL